MRAATDENEKLAGKRDRERERDYPRRETGVRSLALERRNEFSRTDRRGFPTACARLIPRRRLIARDGR